MYDWVTLLYSRNWHNIGNELYFNKKNFLNTVLWNSVIVNLGKKRSRLKKSTSTVAVMIK